MEERGWFGLTPRALLIGAACVIFLSIAAPFSDLVMSGTWIAGAHLPIGALFVFLVMVVGINPLLKKFRIALSQSELLLVYCMMIVGAGIPVTGFTEYLIPTIASHLYYGTPANKYIETFTRNIPSWLTLQDKDAVRQLYEGIPGASTMSFSQLMKAIPWRLWVKPLFFWTIFALGMYLIMFCISVILRKQWVENEKLVFPLVQLPVEMVHEEKPESAGLIPSFFRNRIMWIGFLIPAVIHSINGLHYYYPFIPNIQLFHDVTKFFSEKPWNAINPLWIIIHFSVIGFVYLLPVDLSFSLFFFYWFFHLQAVIGNIMGFPLPYTQGYTAPIRAFAAYQMTGALVVFTVYGFWSMRGLLKDMWRRAFQNARDVDDSNEPVSYRTAFLGLFIGLIWCSIWGAFAGMNFLFFLVAIVLFFITFIGMTRLVSEGGMLFISIPTRPSSFFYAFTGSAVFGPTNLTMLSLVEYVLMFDIRASLMPSIMDTFKITDSARLKRRHLTVGIVLAVVLALLVSYWAVLTFLYKFGGINCLTWFTIGLPRYYLNRVDELIYRPQPASLSYVTSLGVGAGVMLFLFFMRRAFLWWPFHPIGYAMGCTWPMLQLWFSIMIGWAVKTVILKLGGLKIYRKLLPAFLGLVLGEFTTAAVWVIVDMFTGVKGHRIFLF